MLILPAICPDETIYSLLARIARINGKNHLEVVGFLLGDTHPTSVIGCPVNLEYFCEVTKRAFGSPNEILSHSTIFPMLAHLDLLSPSMLAKVENGNRRPELGTLVFGMNKGCNWRICRKCIERDTKIYGIGYWHMTHQLPTSQYCTEHKLMLDSFELPRMNLHEHFILPNELANKIKIDDVHSPIGSRQLSKDITMMGRDAFTDISKPYSKNIIQATFMAGLEQKTLLTDTGEVHMNRYKDRFEKNFDSDVSTTALLRQFKMSNSKQVLNGIANKFSSKPFNRLLLAYFLFDSWAAFKEQSRWEEVMDLGSAMNGSAKSLDRSSMLSVEAMIQQQRVICVNYKISHIDPNRYEFMKKSYRAFRWLRQYDRKWLDEELPMQVNKKGQGRLF